MLLPNLVGEERERENDTEGKCHIRKRLLSELEKAQDLALRNNVTWVASETTEVWGKKAFVIVTNYLIFLCYSDINSAHGATFVLTI